MKERTRPVAFHTTRLDINDGEVLPFFGSKLKIMRFQTILPYLTQSQHPDSVLVISLNNDHISAKLTEV